MNQPTNRLVLIALLLSLVLAPFAGLAPLILLVFAGLLVYAVGSLVQTLMVGDRTSNTDRQT